MSHETNTIDKKCKVYGLSSSEDGRIRYIGQTTQTLRRRLAQHLADAKRKQSHIHCYRWIRKTISAGEKIQIHLIESDCVVDLDETKWIEIYRRLCPDLTNTLNGGQHGRLGFKCSEETRQRMRKPKSAEARKNMSQPRSPETRAKMSLSQMGNTKGRGEANGNSKINNLIVVEIRKKRAAGISCITIAKEYGITKSSVSKVVLGHSWAHVKQICDELA